MSALQLACHVLVEVDELRMWDNSAADCAHVLTFGTERWRPQAQALVQANHRDLAFPPWPAQVVIELRCRPAEHPFNEMPVTDAQVDPRQTVGAEVADGSRLNTIDREPPTEDVLGDNEETG